jgi:hypothetical protein
MAVKRPLNLKIKQNFFQKNPCLFYDISLIEIGQEIKLLEHFKFFLDHPVYIYIPLSHFPGYISQKTNTKINIVFIFSYCIIHGYYYKCCNRSRPCPCYEIFVAVTVIF